MSSLAEHENSRSILGEAGIATAQYQLKASSVLSECPATAATGRWLLRPAMVA